MPEIPDLEAIRHYLAPRLAGHTITRTVAPIPWLIRTGSEGLGALQGSQVVGIRRLGKFLLFDLDDARIMVVNPMLTGRFHWVESSAKKPGMLGVVLGFDHDYELRYSDLRRMGRWYLVQHEGELTTIPQMEKLGPDVMTLDEDAFVKIMRNRRGQVKNTITNQEVIAGIGNAYSDEVLWAGGIHPHRRGATLEEEDWRRLFQAMRSTLDESIEVVGRTVEAEGLGRKEEWREHLKVHRRAGEDCPRCGGDVRGQVRGGSETNYCVSCQPLFA